MNKKATEPDSAPEALIHYQDLSDAARELALNTAKLAFVAKSKSDILYWQQAAELIKKELDSQIGPTWHVIVGSSFGSFVSHEAKNIIFFQIGQMKCLVFKHG
jgi:dynein light chain LC8-type